MNFDSATNSASASGTEFETRGPTLGETLSETRAPRFRVTDVTLPQGRQTAVRGFSLATLAAALAACGGGGGGGPTPPPPPPPPPPANNPPTATDASATAVEDGEPATGAAVGSDEDGDPLTYTVTADGMYGSLAVADDGTWTYTLADSDEIQALGAGATLTDTATIEVSDGEATASATVTITIEGANDDPTGEDGMGAVTAGMDMAAMGSVNAMDVDAGDTHTFEVGDAPAYGTLTVDEAGNWSYMADSMNPTVMALGEGETMEDTGTIVVMDSAGGSAMVTVTVTITGVDDAPAAPMIEAGEGALTISEDDNSGRNLGTLSSEDPEGSALTYSVDDDRFEIETVGNTTLLKIKDGVSLDYESSDNGVITIMVTATDAAGNTSEPMAIAITVMNVNEAPTITFDGDSETPDGTPAVSTIMEHTGDGDFMPTPVGQVMVMDPEEDIATGDVALSDDRFSLMEDDFGGIWLMVNEPLDAEGADGGMVTVTLSVMDSEGLMASTDAVITVTNVNDVPTIELREGVVPGADGGAGASGTLDENTTGPAYEIIVSDAEDNLDASNVMIDDGRFEVKTDSEGGLWAFLREEVNYEEVSSIDITATVTDSDGASASASATVTIRDVNDAPAANQDGIVVISGDETSVMENIFAEAGAGEIEITLDLGAMFSDEDGDTNFRYTIDNAPSWLTLSSVRYGSDGSVTGLVRGNVPPGWDESSFNIEIVATDEGGGAGSALFNIIVDDGNDEITAINLIDDEGAEILPRMVDVDENDDSGMVLGMLTADDQDDPRHPNGMHTFTVVNNPAFETVRNEDGDWLLKVKDGMALDFETSDGMITLMVTAMDGGGSSRVAEIEVNVGDTNDAPTVMNQPGNWWVTVDEDLDAEDATAGQWLTFELENTADGDALPLFADEDNPAGANGMLTYEIVSGPSWLMINDMGTLMNAAGMVPERGIYDVTIRATDGAGASVTADSFQIAVVLSDANNDDNDAPSINGDGVDIFENPTAGTVVGRFTVEDEDLDVAGIHPWGDVKVFVTAMDAATGGTATFAMGTDFQVVMVGEDADSREYELQLTAAGAGRMNREAIEEVDVTVYAYDGTVTIGANGVPMSIDNDGNGRVDSTVNGADIDEFSFEIEDVNEAPALVDSERSMDHSSADLSDSGPLVYPVSQQEASSEIIYLNLSKLFEDPDEDHDDGDVTFTASISNSPWLSLVSHYNDEEERMTTGPVLWEDIRYGGDGRPGGAGANADLVWNGRPGTDPAAPADDDYVLILRVDRTGTEDGNPAPDEISQDNDGMITITAMDEDGASSTTDIAVTIDDQNLHPDAMANGVTLSDTTPRQGQTITVRFDESVDPDFTGPNARSPVAVIYQVINDPTGTDSIVDSSLDRPLSYTVTEGDVGDVIRGKVIYFELFAGSILVSSPTAADALQTDSEAVENRQDPASATFTFTTTGSGSSAMLVADIIVVDPDGFEENTSLNVITRGDPETEYYTWQVSENGRGGWQEFDANGDTANTAMTAIPEEHQGKYVRLVIGVLDQDGKTERLVSDPVKVGAIDTPTGTNLPQFDSNTIDVVSGSNTAPVGRTLRLENIPDGATVEWFIGARMIGTGEELTVSESHRDGEIHIVVTTRDASGSVTSIVSTEDLTNTLMTTYTVTVPALPNTDVKAIVDSTVIDLGAAPVSEGELVELSARVVVDRIFEDLERDPFFIPRVNFDASSAFMPAPDLNSLSHAVGRDDNQGAGEGDQLLIIDLETGDVMYYGTKAQGHDGDSADAGGNLIETTWDALATSKLGLLATGPNIEDADSTVSFRIDVAPTGFEVGSSATTEPTNRAWTPDEVPDDYTFNPGAPYDYADRSVLSGSGAIYEEQVPMVDDQGRQIIPQIALRLDVLDQNEAGHEYGQYTFTVNDPRFEVVPLEPDRIPRDPVFDPVYTDPTDPNQFSAADASQAVLRLKTGQKLDYEAEVAKGTRLNGADGTSGDPVIDLIITATPVSDNFKPITIWVSVLVSDVDGDEPDPDDSSGMDPPSPPDPGNTVPGLKDDEMNDDSDETDKDNGNDAVDEGEDDDEDGGTPAPPMDAMADFISGLDDGMF